jgi:predicted metalloprotease
LNNYFTFGLTFFLIFSLQKIQIMRWQGREGSRNVQDRRGAGRVGAGIGIGGIIIVIIALLMGENPMQLLQQFQGQSPQQTTETPTGTPQDEAGQFVSVVLKDTEDAWTKIFSEQLNAAYEQPILVLFSGSVQSACGFASAASGPFYCPGDNNLYIDLTFYDELKSRFSAPGDFAMAYVVAHEVGHHVQNLLGITDELNRQRGRVSQAEYNQLSVRLELQADFFAGVWAHHAHRMKNILEEGDIEEALRAANAIGDDRLQKQSQGYVVPESFTHGTSEQRMRWFKKGFDTGDISQGDTFSARNL